MLYSIERIVWLFCAVHRPTRLESWGVVRNSESWALKCKLHFNKIPCDLCVRNIVPDGICNFNNYTKIKYYNNIKFTADT